MRFMLPLLAAGLLLAPPAEARMHAPYRAHRIVPATAPLDGFTQPAAAYSMRRLRSTYSGPAIRLRRTLDTVEADIAFLGFTGFTGAPIDTAAAAAHCTTPCTVAVWYDQSGNAKHMSQTTVALQPAYQANCQGTLPCARSTSATQQLINNAVVWASPLTMNAVGRQAVRPTPGSFQSCYFVGAASNQMFQYADGDQLYLTDGTLNIIAPAAGLAWHAATGILTGSAASLLQVDANAPATGIVLTPGTPGNVYTYNALAETCDYAEIVVWSAYALSPAERTALHANQKSFWGF